RVRHPVVDFAIQFGDSFHRDVAAGPQFVCRAGRASGLTAKGQVQRSAKGIGRAAGRNTGPTAISSLDATTVITAGTETGRRQVLPDQTVLAVGLGLAVAITIGSRATDVGRGFTVIAGQRTIAILESEIRGLYGTALVGQVSHL